MHNKILVYPSSCEGTDVVPGGKVWGVKVLFMAIVNLFTLLKEINLLTASSNGK